MTFQHPSRSYGAQARCSDHERESYSGSEREGRQRRAVEEGKARMVTYQGKVVGGTILLQEGAELPEGTTVEVRLLTKREKLKEAIERVMKNRITRPVGMQEIIEEDKQEREES